MNPDTAKADAIRAKRAGRAFGALLLGTFGTAWLLVWAYLAFAARIVPMTVIAVIGSCLLAWAYREYRASSRSASPEPETPERRRAMRIFHMVNFGQWIVIAVAGNVLANIGLGAWVLPMAMGVIGLHFFPLAKVFRAPSRYVTGAALVAVAVIYPFVSKHGPADPVGCLFAGLVLWGSAVLG